VKSTSITRILNRLRGTDEILVDDSIISRQFEREIAHAGNRLAAAIRDQDQYTSKEGLELFAGLARDAIQYHQRLLSDPIDPRRSGGPSLYGDEWRMLLQQLGTIQESASTCRDPRTRNLVVNFFLSLGTRFMREGQYPAARDVISLLGWIWSDMDAKIGEWQTRDLDYFLLRLRETADYIIPTLGGTELYEVHANSLCSIFARLARISISRAHTKNARDAVETLAEARKYAMASDYQIVFKSSQDATLLAILGWLLLNIQNGEDDLTGLAETMMTYLEPRSLWVTLVTASDENFQYALGVTWWEMDGKAVRGMASGVVEIDSYIRIAALLTAVRRGGELGVPESTTDEDGDRAWTLSESLKTLDVTNHPHFQALMPTDAQRADLHEELQTVIDRRDRRRVEGLAAAQLDNSLVQRFHETVERRFDESNSVLDLMSGVTQVTDLSPTFGFNRLENKSWFVDGHVSADPDSLAQSFVAGVRHGEDHAVVEAVRQVAPSDAVPIEGLRQLLENWCHAHNDLVGLVIITNSWRAKESLVGHQYDSTPEGRTVVVELDDMRVSVYQAFDPDPPYLAVFATPSGVQASLALLGEPGPHDVIHAGRLLSCVRRPTAQEETAWANNETTSLDIRQRVVVKVLEGLEVTLRESSHVALWLLPEDIY
jgi:hypothetical protein